MKKAFIVLAHEYPAQLTSLLGSLLVDGSCVVVHYDLSSSKSIPSALRKLESSSEGMLVFATQEKVAWGEWSIVKATLNSVAALQNLDVDIDYVTLLSGSCLLTKPLAMLDAFLTENNGLEFIESVDAVKKQWVNQGYQSERWSVYHYINWRDQPRAFDISVKIQQLIGIKRKLPVGLQPRMGSQWWTLRWGTLIKVVQLMKDPAIEAFFRRVWIPDEMFFQTLVYHVQENKDCITNHSLTQYAFIYDGKPRVFYNDNAAELLSDKRFFARKISPQAYKLKSCSEDIAAMSEKEFLSYISSEDQNLPATLLSGEATRSKFYFSGVASARRNPFYGLRYFIIVSDDSRLLTAAAAEMNQRTDALWHGRLYKRGELEFVGGLSEYAGYKTSDVVRRDVSGGTFLNSLMAATEVPVVGFMVNPVEDRAFMRVAQDHFYNPEAVIIELSSTGGNAPGSEQRRLSFTPKTADVDNLRASNAHQEYNHDQYQRNQAMIFDALDKLEEMASVANTKMHRVTIKCEDFSPLYRAIELGSWVQSN